MKAPLKWCAGVTVALAAIAFAGFRYLPRRPAIEWVYADQQPWPSDFVVARKGTDLAAFARGRAIFEKVFTVAEGLGPFFNDRSCTACHSIPGIGGHGDFEHRVVQNDTRPKHTPTGDIVHAPDEPFHISPSLFGIGVLDDISDAKVLSGCGVDERLGIHGVPGKTERGDDKSVKRFGRVLQTKDVRAFVVRALVIEQGITNPGSPNEPKTCGEDPKDLQKCLPGARVDLDQAAVDDLVTFVAGLAPLPRLRPDPHGEMLFNKTGCAVCHRIDDVYQLGTDLCLHDMGALMERATPTPRPPADPFRRRWVPARLSGIRFRSMFLHDGRAKSVDEAVRAHDGEGAAVTAAYAALADEDRKALVTFVMSL